MSDAAPAPAAAAPAAGGNKMMFIMMGAMFVVLLLGMGGMFFMMKSGNKDAHGEGDAAAAEHAPEDKKAAIYVGFEPPFVVNFPAGSSVQFMQISVQIMTREPAVEHEIKGNDPAIRDALLTLFGQQTVEKMQTAEGKEQLRKDALEAVRGVIAHEGGEAKQVEAVYFTSFVMQ